MKSNQSSIKIKFNKIAKRVVLPESFSDLLATVQKAFAISNFAGHNIGYYDEDADFCQISNEYDYSEAKKYFESFPVNTIVVRVSDATSENLKTENEQVVFDDAYSEVRDDLFFAEVPVTEKKEEVQAEKYEELFFQEVEVHEIPEEQEKQKQQKVTEKVFIEETGEEFYFPSNEELEKSRIFIHEAINNDCVFSNLVNDLNLQVAPLFEKGAQETKEVLSQLFKNAKLGFCETKKFFNNIVTKSKEQKSAEEKEKSDRKETFNKVWNNGLKDEFKKFKKHVKQTTKKLIKKFSKKETSNAVHYGIICDMCETKDIKGIRYKCIDCADYDVCESCEETVYNSHPHNFIKIREHKPSVAQYMIVDVMYPEEGTQMDVFAKLFSQAEKADEKSVETKEDEPVVEENEPVIEDVPVEKKEEPVVQSVEKSFFLDNQEKEKLEKEFRAEFGLGNNVSSAAIIDALESTNYDFDLAIVKLF